MENLENKAYVSTVFDDTSRTYHGEIYFVYDNKLLRFGYNTFKSGRCTFKSIEHKEEVIEKAVRFCETFGIDYEIKPNMYDIKRKLTDREEERRERAELRRLKEKYEKKA